MWYVNQLYELSCKLFENEFYINYVVCKLVYYERRRTEKDKGFILTMWYVNQLISFLLQVLLFSFYINYVVCKYSFLRTVLRS